jgi:uncharacterized protein
VEEWSDLRKAVEAGDVATARSLLAAGADVNDDHGHESQPFSVLHHAIDLEVDGFNQTGRPPSVEMIELLIEAGAAVSERNYLGQTPLEMAHGHPAVEAVIERALGRL